MSSYTTAGQLKAQLLRMIDRLDNVAEDLPVAILDVDGGGYSDPVITEKIILSLENDKIGDCEQEDEDENEDGVTIEVLRLYVRYKQNY